MMPRPFRLAIALCMVAILVPPASAHAMPSDPAGTSAIVALPGSRSGTYATPIVVVEKGDELTLVNAEPFAHSVRSFSTGPDDVPWCEPWNSDRPQHRVRNPRQFPIGKCPLLWSLAITMTTGAVETKVYGTKNLKPGSTVEFYCTVFPAMRGTLIVQ
jgi:hypothetical protein